MKFLKILILADDGVTAIEYALMASLIAVVIFTSVELVGTKTSDLYAKVQAAFP